MKVCGGSTQNGVDTKFISETSSPLRTIDKAPMGIRHQFVNLAPIL